MQTENKFRTLAHQLSQILRVYADSFEQWRLEPSDVGRYERTHANLDLVRVLTDKTFPGGRGELGELMLAHADLKMMVLRRHMTRQSGDGGRNDFEAPLQALQTRHDDAVAALLSVCVQRSGSLARQGAGAAGPSAAPATQPGRRRPA